MEWFFFARDAVFDISSVSCIYFVFLSLIQHLLSSCYVWNIYAVYMNMYKKFSIREDGFRQRNYGVPHSDLTLAAIMLME